MPRIMHGADASDPCALIAIASYSVLTYIILSCNTDPALLTSESYDGVLCSKLCSESSTLL